MLPITRRLTTAPLKGIRLGFRFKNTAAYDSAIQALRQDLKTSIRMKADVFERNVIKSILTEVKNLEVANAGKDQDEFQLYDLLAKMVNQRKKTAEEYLKEGAPDRFQQMGLNELREIPYIEKYMRELPVASESEIEARVEAIAKELQKDEGLSSPKALFGKIPWKTIQEDWHASRAAVSAVIPKVYEKLA
ncbi:hypothetical protein KL919_004956 [Ogataea angusta]|nr:hypothetical protein KL919_004956 [Ogataea angusta]